MTSTPDARPQAGARPAEEARARAGRPGNEVAVRTDISAHALRLLARRTPSLRASLRMRAVAHVLAGASLAEAAAGAHVRTRTLQNWIARYNAEGVEGLADRSRELPRAE
ncbi:helix-turn-helix domain-containing protein [Ancylobacter sp. FA202]|uniref:helix-turn-helix domain-containing protein n=1 Tax=Ancylobacter sp. FA202 TaxID=1111106 RepID=UPI000364D3EC|nr:helix-turn-helix domain-containing protein [Ancylobacter sp. FA202]